MSKQAGCRGDEASTQITSPAYACGRGPASLRHLYEQLMACDLRVDIFHVSVSMIKDYG
jgi:hypothetical protein